VAASRADRTLRALAAALFAAALSACATPAPTPVGSALEPLSTLSAQVPDDADIVARDLAASALAEPRVTSEALLARLELIEHQREAAGELPTGLVPAATDLVNATLDDPITYRAATRELLERDDLPEALHKRLEADVDDDPLRLADRRMRDALIKDTAEIFNALARPLSRMALTPLMGGISLAQSLLSLALSERMEDPLEFRERQALAHWKHFLDAHPDSPEAPGIALRAEETQLRWNETRRNHYLRDARAALRRKNWDAAFLLADRAERYAPEDHNAVEMRERAAVELATIRTGEARSLQADPSALELDAMPGARELAIALLLPRSDLEGAALELLESDPDGPLADEARYALALSHHEVRGATSGTEDGGWNVLGGVSKQLGEANMARHAQALVNSPRANPWAAFKKARVRDRLDKVKWVMFGPMAKGPRRRDLPRPVEWLIDLPGIIQSLSSFPTRLAQFAFIKPWPFGRATAIHARQYLNHRPGGAHADEISDWLQDWHGDRGNWLAAWEVATDQEKEEAGGGWFPDLRARAARQALDGAKKQQAGDMRLSLLRRVAGSFHDTDAGREAASLARDELMKATTQRIRISRGFLLENPGVAGPDGLALRPELLDGDTSNGELHPQGVILAGGQVLEFNYVGESGRMRKPATVRRQRVSGERLSRLVALLDETALNNYQEDPGDILGADSKRDLFFERARLGVADTPDRRPEARSTYSFLGMRERYGVVRGREPILPFDIVFTGSLPDLSFNVYPRMRSPRPTPDSVLFR
jgi:hypothetical protein